MKKLFIFGAVLSVMGLFSSCAKSDIAEIFGGKEIKVIAHATSSNETTKVSFNPNEDGTYASLWGESEAIEVFEVADKGKELGLAAVKSTSYTPSADAKSADFGFSLTTVEANSYDYYALSPSSAWGSASAKKEGIYIKLPAVQTPGTDSADPAATILVGKDLGYDAQPSEIQFAFRHLTAYAKVNITNLAKTESETVKSVVLTAAGKALAGGFDYNYSDGSLSSMESAASTSVTANTASLENVWFAVEPTSFEAGDVLTVAVVTDKETYTREITFSAAKSFKAGHVAKMTVDMSTATTVDYSGTYVPMVYSAEKYYALSSTASTTRLSGKEVSYNGTDASFTTTDETIVWTIAKEGSSYTMADQSDPVKYLAWTDDKNSAATTATAYALQISQNTNGTYKIASAATPARYIQFLASGKYFAFYTSAQVGEIHLVPADYKALPNWNWGVESITIMSDDVAAKELTITTNAASVEIGAFDDEAGTTASSWLTASYADGKVTYKANSANTGTERVAYIVVKATNANGSKTIALKVVQTAPSAVGVLALRNQLTATTNATANTYTAVLNGAVVTNVNGSSAYIEDESGAILLYQSGHSFTAGQSITGTVTGKGYIYNGLPELISMDVTNATVTSGATIPLTEVTLVDLFADYEEYLSRRVKLTSSFVANGVSGTDRDGVVYQDANSIAIRAQLANVVEMSEGDVVDIIGYPSIYNSNKQLGVWATDDIDVSEAEAGNLTIPSTAETIAVNGTYTIVPSSTATGATYAFVSSDTAVATVSASGVVTGVAAGSATIAVVLKAGSGYACNVATLKVTVEKEGLATIKSFTAVSGNINADISYASNKGGAATAPAVNGGQIRLYQIGSGKSYGGYITISAASGKTIKKATIGSAMATSVAYTVDSDTTLSDSASLAANGTYTVENLSASSITFYCMGTSSTSRLYVNLLEIEYE